MDLLSRILGPATIASGASTVFTGTTAHVYTIKSIVLVNNTAGTISVALGINGVADANLILPPTPLGPGESAEFDGLLILSGTETLDAITNASGIAITASGLDQS